MKPICTFFLFITLLFVNELFGNHPPYSTIANTNNISVVYAPSSVSPSPAHDYATIKFSNPQQKEHQIEVFDLIGNKVQYLSKIVNNKALVNVSSLDSGFYLYFILQNNKRVSSGRIVVR